MSRCALLRTGTDRYELVVTYGHLLLDGWSLSLMVGELAQAYAARLAGREHQGPQRSPFSGYVAWSRAVLERGGGEAFWRAELGDFEGTRELPLSVPAEVEEHCVPVLAAVDRSAVETIEKRERVTLASVVAGCWAVLLSRYGGSEEVLFGMTSSGRRAEVEGGESMMGMLIETRPARVRVDEQAPLGTWLRSLMQAEARREEAGAVSLAQIESWSGAQRGARLFETLMGLRTIRWPRLLDLLGGGMAVENVRTVERTNWPLTVVVMPEDGQLQLGLLYDPARYERAAIEQVGRHFVRLLGSAAQATLVGELQMLEEEERQRLLDVWSGANQALATPRRTIVERIEEQAAMRPDASALRLGEQRMSYGD